MVLIDGLYDYLSNMLAILIQAIIYPFSKLFFDLYGIFYNIYSSIAGIVTAFYNLMYVIYAYLSDFLTIFPSAWSYIILASIVFVICIRIYNLAWGGNDG